MRLATVTLLALLAALQVRIWAGEGGVATVWRLERAIEAQRAENARLRARNDRLAAEVRDLKEGLAAVEARARRELGLVGRGETFYQIVDPLARR